MHIIEAKSKLSKYQNRDFRANQEEAIQFILESHKRFVFLEAPTGSGKSLCAMTAGVAMGGVTYSVHSKVLQNQITQDFPEAKSLFGRSNYPCKANPDVSCNECFHTKTTPCSHKGDCVYEVAKKQVLRAELRILNYDYLLSEINYVGRFSKSKFNIIDEGDNLENTFVNFVTLTFTSYALSRLGLAADAELLKQTSKFPDQLIESWKEFAGVAKSRAISILDKLDREIETYKPESEAQVRGLKEKTRVTRLLEKIVLFIENVDSSWILDTQQKDKYIFRPLWLTNELAEEFLWRHAKRWVLMSASFLPIHLEAKRLGIPLDEIDYKLLPSTFPVERRRVIVNSVADLVMKNMDVEVPKVIKEVKNILLKHPNERGLIHGVSYRLSKQIFDGVADPRLLIHDSSNRQMVVESFLSSEKNTVLISPSLERGISLDYDKARFQIILKMPWLSLGDKIVAARVYSSKMGNEWFQASALLTVLQMCGRACRSDDDFSITYILDYQFKKVLLQKPRYLPEWFREAIEFV